MCRKLFLLTSFLLVLGLVGSASAALPQGWQSQDIGTTDGSAEESDGTWTISADGADVWGSSDEFHYAYMPLSGDGTIIAQVVDNGTGSNGWAKGGVMIRETLDADSKHAIMALTGGEGGGMAFQNRQETGGSSFSSHGEPTAAPPYWVKLTRVGNTIAGYSSADGVEWVQQPDGTGGDATTNPVDIEMAADVYIGLFVTSHASGEVRTYTFDNVNVSVVKPTGANIIWVSDFYDDNGDGAPDDQPWVDLLEAQGYTVDYTPGASPGDGYWRTLDDDKIAALNAADLIIVSRNSSSGDYDDGDEPTQWNSVTTPLILQATHIVRSNRWRWLDTTTTNNATPTIQVLDLCNPVFNRVPLDVNGQVDIVTDANSTFAGTDVAGNGALIATRADTNEVAIVEWEAGVEFYPGAGQTAGGPRLYFPAGTQEVAADVIGRGEYNLTPEGERIFLDAVAVFVPPIVVSSDVTAPGDTVQGVPDDGDWPGNEAPPLAIDDNVETKYLHFKGDFEPDPGTGGSGFRVTPSACPSVVTGLTFTTANDVPGRDPIAFELSGSNEGIDGPYELIATGDIVDFAQELEWPRFTKNETPISFDNDVAYNHYQLIFPAIRGPVGGSVNSMQIAEVELLRVRRRCENIGIPSTCPPVMPTPIYSKTDSVGNLLELWCTGAYHLCFTPAGSGTSCQIGECIFTKGENVGWVCYDPWGKFTSVTWLNYEGHDYPGDPSSPVYSGDDKEDRDTYIYDVASGTLTKTRHKRQLKPSRQSDPGSPWVHQTTVTCHCPPTGSPNDCDTCPTPSGITVVSNVPRITPVRFVGSIQGGGQVVVGIHGTQVVVPTTAGMDVQQLAQQTVDYFNLCWQGPQGPQVPSQSQQQRQQQTKFASIDPGYGQVVQFHNVDEQEICIRVVGEPELTYTLSAYPD